MRSLYSVEWRFFKNNLMVLLLSMLGVYILMAIISNAIFAQYSDVVINRVKDLAEYLESQGLMEAGPFKRFILIFLNNFRVSIVSALLGVIPFLFLPFLIPVFNGFILGFLVIFLGEMNKSVPLYIAASILPHGIFELPAIFYAASLGIYITRNISLQIAGKPAIPEFSFKGVAKQIGRSFGLVITPVLIVAAFIESYITPIIIGLLQ